MKLVTFLRNQSLHTTRADAIAGIKSVTNPLDGSIVMGRYKVNLGTEENPNYKVRTIFGIYNSSFTGSVTGDAGYTIYDSYEEIIQELSNRLDELDGGGATGGSILQRIDDAIAALDDNSDTAQSGKYITAIQTTNGIASPKGRANISEAPLNNYNSNSEGTITSSDTINTAISKLVNKIEDANEDIAEAKTTISTTVGGNASSHLTITSDSTAADGHTQYSFALNNVASPSDITTAISNLKGDATTSGDTLGELEDRIEGLESGVKTYTIRKDTTNLPAGVKEQYTLVETVNGSSTDKTVSIPVYSDTSLASVKLLHATDSTKPTYNKSTDTWTDIASAGQTEANLALCFAYETSNGTIQVEAIPVGSFLRESEFKNGLTVSNTGEVSVKLSTATESQKYLRFDSNNAVEVYGVDSAINTEKTRAQAAEAEIANKVGLTGAEGARTYTPTTNYPGTANTVKDNMLAIDTQVKANADAISSLLNNALTGVTINGSSTNVSTSNHVADLTINGGTVKLTNYSTETASILAETDESQLAIQNTDSTNLAIAKLYRTIVLDENTIAAALNEQNDVNVEQDARLDALEADVAEQAIIAGNGINTSSSSSGTTVSVKLDTVSTTTSTHNLYSSSNGNVLELSSNGLYLSEIWDCGTY